MPLGSGAQSRNAEIRAHLSKATEDFTAQNWKAAAEEYADIIKLDPGNAPVLARLGVVYQRLGMLSKAQDCLEQALRIEPDLPDAGVVLSFVDAGLGKYRKAVPLLEKALDDPHDDLPVRLAGGERLVDIDFALGNEDQGLDAVEKLRKLAPDDPNVLYTASRAYSTMWKNAVERMYRKDPNSYRTHQVLAEAAEAKGNLQEAAKEYRIVITLEPNLPGAHYELGRIILDSNSTPGGMQQALAEFQKELETDPHDVPAHSQMGEIYLKMHRLDDAAAHFSQAIRLQPSFVDARLGMGKVFLERRQFQQAADEFQQAARLAPANQTAYYELMIADRALGRAEEARLALANFQRLRKQAEEQQSFTLKQLQAPLIQSSHPNP